MFKASKAKNYKAIMRGYAKTEIDNNTRVAGMWKNVLEHHAERAHISNK